MLLLTSTSDTVRIVTATASALDVHASWVDLAGRTATPGRTNTAISSATTTVVVASPAASTSRNVKRLSVRNDGTSSNVVTVEHYDGTTAVTLHRRALAAGETVVVSDDGPPYLIDAGGRVTFAPFEPAAARDAFGRFRVSQPETIFDSKLVYDAQPLYWSEAQTGGATAGTWSATNACVTLSVVAGQSSIRQSKRYFNYQPGKSQAIFQTFNLRGAAANLTKRAGYFDATNGLFLELSGTTVNFVRRSGSSVATETVAQSAWNLDPMDGSGPSGITINWATTLILVIDFEWLGVGSIRMGFNIGGATYYCHQFDNSNIQTAVYMTTPNLPIRYEITGGAGLVGSGTIDCICSTVISEGGQQSQGTMYAYVRTASTANVASGASAAILSIRPAAATPRATIRITGLSALAGGNSNMAYQLVLNGTLATPLVVTAADRGYCDVSETLSIYTPGTGTVLGAGLVSSAQRSETHDLLTFLTLAADIAGTTDILSLVVTNLSNGNETYRGAMDWVALT